MPIYEFQCQSCGNEVEVLQKISDAPLTVCPACGNAEMKKKVSAAAFRLSGRGWYETDFKSGDNKKNLTESKTDKKPSSDSKPATTGNPDKKPKEKSTTKSA